MDNKVETQQSPGCCQLCGRPEVLTRHHLIPRAHHQNKKIKRLFDREHMLHALAWLCKPCHKHIHAVFSEKQLALHFHDIDRLAAHEEVDAFVRWIKTKPPGMKPKSPRRRR